MVDKLIIGAIAGDIVGTKYAAEGKMPVKPDLSAARTKFSCNSVMIVAVMDSLLNGRDYTSNLQRYAHNYPGRGYGAAFLRWISQEEPKPYHSWNNGAALRVIPIGFAGRTLAEVEEEAARCARLSHNHPDGLKGAVAVASAVFLAKNGRSKEEIRDHIENEYGYDMHRTIEEIKPGYYYDQSTQGSVPEAIIAFLDSSDFEDALRLAVSLGDRSGTITSITGALAQAYYKEIPAHMVNPVVRRLTPEMYEVIENFSRNWPLSLFH